MNERYERSSGNVFADLGHPDPETALAKAKLALKINATIEDLGWNDVQAAHELGLSAEHHSALARGRLSEFTTDDLLGLLMRLNLDADINVGPNRSTVRPARIAVHSRDEPTAATAPGRAADTVRFD